METIIDAMENEISEKKNDYFIKNVIFSMGFDLLCYEPNIENAIKNLLYFLRKFVEVLRAAFDPNGPKRFKSMSTSTDSISIQIPKLIILTIPFIDSHPFATTFKHQIMAMNEALRKYVKENKEKSFNNFNQIIEIYDWESEAHDYGQCNRADLESRFKVLTTALSEKHQMFMVKHESDSHGFEQNDSNGYDSQDYDSEELQG
uniref:Uncharacterized protein n=1 Tax=Panagrolaimus sp. PS1159 TaxID=55785 RepID=A0AC35FAX7_9BILA